MKCFIDQNIKHLCKNEYLQLMVGLNREDIKNTMKMVKDYNFLEEYLSVWSFYFFECTQKQKP